MKLKEIKMGRLTKQTIDHSIGDTMTKCIAVIIIVCIIAFSCNPHDLSSLQDIALILVGILGGRYTNFFKLQTNQNINSDNIQRNTDDIQSLQQKDE